jgi:hypothetical protein
MHVLSSPDFGLVDLAEFLLPAEVLRLNLYLTRHNTQHFLTGHQHAHFQNLSHCWEKINSLHSTYCICYSHLYLLIKRFLKGLLEFLKTSPIDKVCTLQTVSPGDRGRQRYSKNVTALYVIAFGLFSGRNFKKR